MHADFTSVEAELREIEADFSSGRMNAFGSASAQDAFLRELKRIAEIETQVFYKTCSILKNGNNADHALLTSVFASAQPPPQARSAGTGQSPGGGHAGSPRSGGVPGRTSATAASFDGGLGDSMNRFAHGGGSMTGPGPLASIDTLSADRNPMNSSGDRDIAGGAAPHIRPANWGNESGFPDSVFEDVADRFHSLEADFNVLGAQLRLISSHVAKLSAMSEEVNRSNSNNNSGSGAESNANAAEDLPSTIPPVGVDGGRPLGGSTGLDNEDADDALAGDGVSGPHRTVYWQRERDGQRRAV